MLHLVWTNVQALHVGAAGGRTSSCRFGGGAVAMSAADGDSERPLKAVIAGGGIGGLCTAVTLQSAGWDVEVFERTREYRPFGGPIQIASNGLEALSEINPGMRQEILDRGNVIGDRKNGLKDGISNEWFATFDLYSPAVRRGQTPSLVIDRPILQEILMKNIKDAGAVVRNGCEVVGCERTPTGVTALLADGSKHEGDVLIGSDGLNSKVRTVLNPEEPDPVWSGYTCFAAIAYTVPDDIADVGYKVYLGRRKYFVSVDVGGGRIQWYAAAAARNSARNSARNALTLTALPSPLAGMRSSTCRRARSRGSSRRARASSSTCGRSTRDGRPRSSN